VNTPTLIIFRKVQSILYFSPFTESVGCLIIMSRKALFPYKEKRD